MKFSLFRKDRFKVLQNAEMFSEELQWFRYSILRNCMNNLGMPTSILHKCASF